MENDMNKTVLITGVAGLLGARLADWILENHPETTVVGVDDLSGGYMDNVDPRVIFYKLDLGKESAEHLFSRHKPDVVYHFAAYAAEALSPFIRQYNYTNNLVATAGIINQCISHNVKRIVFTSSMAVYGNNTIPFDETMIRNPVDSYGIAKMACEMDLEVAGDQHGLDWCIIRPHNVYGAKQNIWDSYRNVLGIWMYKHIHGQPFTIFGDGEQTRAFSYIDDSVKCLWDAGWLPQCSKQIINLGGIHHVSVKEAAHILRDIVGGAKIEYLPPRHEVKHAYPTWQKSVELLGFEHKTDLHEGLKKMWEWAQQQPIRPRQIWNSYELEKGLYPFWDTRTLISQAHSAKLL
jgi:UDP-glucose 4-epimerase